MRMSKSLTLLAVLVFSCLITSTVASSYQSTFAKGTEEFTVIQYNNNGWKNTVNNETNPTQWFEGDSNVVGAKSKVTYTGWVYSNWTTYDVLTSIFMTGFLNTSEIFILLNIMNSQGYNETTINANYTSTYDLWVGVRAIWNFTTGDYEEEPSYSDGNIILRDPHDYKVMLDDYNNLSMKLNMNPIIFGSGFSFPIQIADDFLFGLALNIFAIPEPQDEYLIDIIDELECVNVSTNNSTLSFKRYGVTDYTVEITYGYRGTMSTFTVKDMSDSIIFKFTSSNTDWIFYTILTTSGVFALIIIVYIIYKGRKLKKR